MLGEKKKKVTLVTLIYKNLSFLQQGGHTRKHKIFNPFLKAFCRRTTEELISNPSDDKAGAKFVIVISQNC